MFASKDVFQTASSGPYTIGKSVRLRSSATAYLNRTPASAGNRKTWTWSAWVKRGTLSSGYPTLFQGGTTSSDTGSTAIIFAPNDRIYVQGFATNWIISNGSYRDPSAWYHIVVAMDSTQATATNRLKLYVNGSEVTYSTYNNLTQNTDYGINQAASHVIGQSIASFGNNYFDGYLAEINFIDGQALTPSSFGSTNALTGVWQPAKYTGTYGTNGFYLNFSDNSAATPATLGKDSSGATSNVIVGSSTNASTTLTVVSISGISVGNIVNGPGIPSNTYVTAIGVLQVTLSQAATSTNASQNYTFSGNNWTPNNISVTSGVTYDSMVDSPTVSAVSSNYCVLNPLDKTSSTTASDGNLTVTLPNGVTGGCGSTIAVSSGKWYLEVTPTSGSNIGIGIVLSNLSQNGANDLFTTGYCYYQGNGNKYVNGSVSAYGSSYAANDVIGIALDITGLTITFYKNNVSQGAISIASGEYKFTSANGASASSQVATFNFGQRPFTYTPPTGFVALNTYNLPASTITNGAKYMDVSLWTGTSATQTITNGGFYPDFLWIKSRSAATDHTNFDSVRGANKVLNTDLTAAEYTPTANTGLSSFNSNGFTLYATDVSGAGSTNFSPRTYVGWQWNAGSGSSSSNTNGSITSTVSANTTAGFSVVSWTPSAGNDTVGHGLGVAPSLIIAKPRTISANWPVYHVSLGATQVIYLSATGAASAGGTTWNNTNPTSTVFSTSSWFSGSGACIAYCFAAVKGFSAFGSYTGNGSTDGPFVYLGFRPRWVMIKNITSANSWPIRDTSRSPYNTADQVVWADQSGAEQSGASYYIDILSNGFKLRNSTFEVNGSATNYIYAAFAENPTKYALAR